MDTNAWAGWKDEGRKKGMLYGDDDDDGDDDALRGV